MNVQPFLIGEGWQEVLDGNDTARAIFDRHYSRRRYTDGRKPKLIIGPGEKLLLLTARADAFCAWRRAKKRDDGQTGVECCIFRREGGEDTATELLRAAITLAWRRWPGQRLFTFVDPRKVAPTMERSRPVWGMCFYRAGFHFEGLTKKRGLHILARSAPEVRPC